MKIKNLIKKLSKIESKHGDVEVFIEVSGFGGHSIHKITDDVSLSAFNLQDLLYSDFSDEKTIKNIFPEWNDDMDSEQELTIDYVELSASSVLYST